MKIICIGRNYSDHAKELNNAIPAEPVFFMKPDTALLKNKDPFYLPAFSANIHHEVELVLQIGKMGKHIEEQFAFKYIDKIGVGIDFTARDLQDQCKEKGLPWEKAKAFDGSAPLGELLPFSTVKDPANISFHLEINGKIVQQGNSASMLFSFSQIIAYVSQFITLKTGDLIYTGTPSGVGPVKIGDRLRAYMQGQALLECEVK
jgi:acylpyruvate hydrolase